MTALTHPVDVVTVFALDGVPKRLFRVDEVPDVVLTDLRVRRRPVTELQG